MFGTRKSAHENLIWQILDSLYRIEEEEVQDLFGRLFGLRIEAGIHKFTKSPDKLGAKGSVFLVCDPNGMELPGELVYTHPPITLYCAEDKCALRYKTEVETFKVFFQGRSESIRDWCRYIKAKPDTYASIFLYIFNRNRAAGALERQTNEERTFITRLFGDFRGDKGPSKALQRIASITHFDWAVVSIYGSMTNKLLPIFASNTKVLRHIDAFSTDQLPAFNEIIKEPKVHFEDISHGTTYNRLCKRMLSMGAREACFLKFGYDPLKEGLPRGIICLYRRAKFKIKPRDNILLSYTAREVAAWIDELDEKTENDIIESAIKIAESECGSAAVVSVSETIFGKVLSRLGESVSNCLNQAFGSQVKGEMKCGFIADKKTIGSVPQRLASTESQFAQQKTPFYIVDSEGLCAVVRSDGAFSLISSAQKEPLTVLRPHVYDWLFLLMKLVYHLVVVEKRRLVGMQRIVHLIRQPLQGFIATISEIRRLLKEPKIPRIDIDRYAEDTELSVLRLKVLLQIFNNIMGIREITPRRKDMLIEDDVLRPMRRLLEPHARKRHVRLSPTYGFDVIPTISSDPDLLSVIFYNLLDNAIKYSFRKTEIQIFCRRRQETYEVEVRNKGPEIKTEEVDKVFWRGYRGINVRNKEVGLGLGLFVASHIARLLSCELELAGTGRGDEKVTFKLHIPRRSTDEDSIYR